MTNHYPPRDDPTSAPGAGRPAGAPHAAAGLGARLGSGVPFDGRIRPGDYLVRVVPYEGIRYSARVISDCLETASDLAERGVPVEAAGQGHYVEVRETPIGGGPSRIVGRRLTDAWGRVARGQALLRAPHEAVREADVAFVEDVTPPHGPGTGDLFHRSDASATILLSVVQREVARQALQEMSRWRTPSGTLVREGDTPGRAILAREYWPAVGVADPLSTFGAGWWSAQPWSAAFVSFVCNTAARRLGVADILRGSAAHMRYVWQAYRDRVSRRVERYWAYPPDAVAVDAGDIVVKSRGTGNAATWTDVTAPAYRSKPTHGDIVAAVTSTSATVIGGNVGHTVDRRSYPLSSGRIDTGAMSNSANRVFAVLKLIGGAA